MDQFKLDDFDRQILNLVQRDNRLSSERLGSEIGLSTASVQRRLRRLRADGIIKQDIAVIERRATDYTLQLVVQIFMEREDAKTLQRFRTQMEAHSCVQQIFYVTGQTDFFAIMIARDISHFEAIAEQLFLANPDVKSYITSVVMGSDKQTLSVPICEPE